MNITKAFFASVFAVSVCFAQGLNSSGTVKDADGNVYKTVKIGKQVWMAENLRVTKYNDGTAIPKDTSSATWNNATTAKYCFYNNTTNTGFIKKYGALYNGAVINPANPKKLAPDGWHVPSDSEWTIMENYLTKNNRSGFSILLGGYRDSSGSFYSHGESGLMSDNFSSGYWWTATTKRDVSLVWYRGLGYVSGCLNRFTVYFTKSCGFSVRLVKD